MTVVSAPRVVADGRVLAPGTVQISGGRVLAVTPGRRPDATLRLDTGLLAPGLIDLQVNGAFGIDLVDATPEQWRTVAGRLLRTGVTGYLPTFITAPVAELAAALGRVRAARTEQRKSPDEAGRGARILGVHVEGPFLSARRRGAHDERFLVDPTPERVEAMLAAGDDGLMSMLTLAPEREHALAAVQRLASAGVVVAVGHSDAPAGLVSRAADAGASMVTHLFNAQSGTAHRNPGVAAQGLVDPRLTCGLIADLTHVAPELVRLAFAAAPGRIALVTDAAAAAGMPPGRYVLGGEEIELPADGPPVRADGTLAGSGLRLDLAVANAVACGVDLPTALAAASAVPARVLGRDEVGRLRPGERADLVWLSDDLRALGTWVDGEPAWRDPRAPGWTEGAER